MGTGSEEPARPSGTGRGRKLNIIPIKQGIVLLAGFFTAVGSAVTGLGAQVAFAPMLSWMLGFNVEKAQGTAMRYALFAVGTAIIGLSVAGLRPVSYLLGSLLMFIGATVGAILTAKLAPRPDDVRKRQIFQTLGALLMVAVILQTAQSNLFRPPFLAQWNSPFALLGIGILAGALTQALALPGGMLLVAAVHFLSGFRPQEAVAFSLLVVLLASFLPAWSYARRGLADSTYGFPAAVGGVIGGLLGGLLLPRIPDKWVMYFFAVVAMFLCARELARLALEKPSPPHSNAE
jgi:uncharacterized membrane protein YfcA